MTRYRYARTLDDAFGPDAYSDCAITCYRAPIWPRVLLWGLFLAALALVIWRI